VLQRWTGIIAFIFIGWHVWTERFGTGGMSTYADVADGMRNPLYLALYVIGILAASFHLGNGVWNFACKWGIAVSVRSQRAFGWLGAAIAVAFSVAGLAIIAGFYYNWHPLGGYLPK
jgi:succinate dehydrogenase / fumarate reductase cytochrome b subunit